MRYCHIRQDLYNSMQVKKDLVELLPVEDLFYYLSYISYSILQ